MALAHRRPGTILVKASQPRAPPPSADEPIRLFAPDHRATFVGAGSWYLALAPARRDGEAAYDAVRVTATGSRTRNGGGDDVERTLSHALSDNASDLRLWQLWSHRKARG